MTKKVAFRIYFLAATLEGAVAFILLFRVRSMERNTWILGYSAPRVALGALALIALIAFIWLTARSFHDGSWLMMIGEWLDKQISKGKRLLVISVFLLSFALSTSCILIGFSPSLFHEALFYTLRIAIERVYPAILWATALSIQSLALLVVLYKETYRQKILRNRQVYVILILMVMIASASVLRLASTGNLSLSIATADTPNIIDSSRIPLLSWDFLTSNRTPTIALIYKILEPPSGYDIVGISEPAISRTVELEFNPGLYRVAISQHIIAMLCWFTLAVVVARHLGNLILKIFGALLVLLFAISPQLTEWDSVLMSESISFSLFALVLALSLELSVRIAHDGRQLKLRTKLLSGMWLVVLLFWVFTRDSNAYLLLAAIGALGVPLLIPRLRNQVATRYLLVMVVLLGLMFFFHNVTLNQSDRWVNPFLNNLIHNILPHDGRVAFFESHGMPVSDELLAFQTSRGNERGFFNLPGFMDWVWDRGFSTYTLFLLNDPVWTVSTFLNNVDYLFSVNIQPYFRRPYNPALTWLSAIGDYLHTTASSSLILVILLALGFLVMVFLNSDRRRLSLGYIFIWLMLAEFVMLFVGFHGDTLGVQRHTLVALIPFRLSLWILAIFVIDQAVSIAQRRKVLRRQLFEA
jgi:hypothetical protein